jgi:MoxR-like ATPase
MAYFRGNRIVELEDVRQILPFVLQDKLAPDLDAPFFSAPGNSRYRSDRVGWLRKLLDLSCADFDRLNMDKEDAVGALAAEFRCGLDGLTAGEVRSRLVRIERSISDLTKGRKLYGHLYDDLLKLKYLHQRYTNYLRWLSTR